MDRNGNESRDKGIFFVIHNSNGNPAKMRMMKDLVGRLSKGNVLIAVFNDVRIQKSTDARFEGFSTIVKNDQNRQHYSGGSLIIFPTTWTAKEYNVKSKEGFVIELKTPNNDSFIIASEYVHPGGYIDKSIMRKISDLNKNNDKKIILAGDFNSAAKEFGSRTDTPQGAALIDAIAESNLNYVENSCPTYISRSTGHWNVLDFIFASDKTTENILSLDVSEATESDHFPLILRLKSDDSMNERKIKFTNWHKFKENLEKSQTLTRIKDKTEKIKADLVKGNKTVASISEDLNNIVKEFSSEIIKVKDRVSVEKTRNAKKDFKISKETMDKIKERRKLANLIKVNKNSMDVSEIKRKLNRVTSEMRNCLKKDKLEHYKIQTENIKTTRDSGKKWKIFNSFLETNKRDNNPLTNLKTKEGLITSTTNQIVDTHALRLKETHQPRPPDPPDVPWMNSIKIDNVSHREIFEPLNRIKVEEGDDSIEDVVKLETVVDIIRKLKTNSAPGDDKVDNATVKQLPGLALEGLVDIFFICFQVGLYPDDWKRAKVRMLLKPGKPPDDSSSYRPISLLSCLGKILEKLIKLQLDQADKQFKLVPEIHAGFRPKRSTQECFLRLGETIGASKKKKKVVVGAFIDIDKAFDRLNHDVIKYRVRRIPIPRKTVRLIASFLTNRRLYVADGDVTSIEVEMAAGAPQGAIMSPTLYIICSSDAPLDNDEDEGSSLYADDTSLWVVADSPREAVGLLQRRLHLLETWCRKWALNPSPTKSEIIVLAGTKRQKDLVKELEVTLMGERVMWKDSVKFLGVQIDSNQNWKEHIDNLINKSYSKVVSICRLNRKMNYANREVVMSLFNTLIMSSFTYSCLAYINMPEYSWSRVENFLTRALKQIFDLPMNMSSNRAREIFKTSTFREDIEAFARRRICGLINSSSLTKDMIANYRDYADIDGKDTILDRICRTAGIIDTRDCYLCTFRVEHDCVDRACADPAPNVHTE